MSEEKLINRDIEETLSSAFLEYAGYNLQRRAIPDARDGLKWGARQLLHAQMLGKFTYDKPFKKAIKSVSQAMGFSYVHGDASAYGTFIRMAKPFAMNIPLQEASGNYGTLINPKDHSASRYVELRGSEAAAILLKDINKNTIDEWEDTYDLEGQFPKVLPAKGFWNLVNGCISIGSGMSCSIPPTNLKEVNKKMVALLWDNNIPEEDLVVMPDFPTGAIVLNAEEVRESMMKGYGSACKIRALVEFDDKERCFIVKEMPYSTYTNTICEELAALMEEEPNCGIQEFVDYTGQKPDLRIYLTKKANANSVLKTLYSKTSLQTFFSINMVALDKGIEPRQFTWKELLLAHLEHERTVYIRGFQFDLTKIEARLHIIEGLLRAIADIDEVVKTIKASTSTATASIALQKLLAIDEVQAKAILDIKLARLAHLEIDKLKNEQTELSADRDRISAIINSPELLNCEIEKGLQEVANKFGDARRTQILNIEHESDEPTEIKSLLISATNKNNFYLSEASSLYTQKRGGVGTKFKLDKGEFVTKTCSADNIDTIMLFTDKGLFYHAPISSIPIEEKVAIETVIQLKPGEKVSTFIPCNKTTKENQDTNILFITKKGMLKKSSLTEYNLKRTGGIKALELDEGDSICAVMVSNDERIGILTAGGQFMQCETKDVRAIGRVCRGVKSIKLNEGDWVISARPVPNETKEIISITTSGAVKRSSIEEFSVTGRNTKGGRLQKLKDNKDSMVDFLPLMGSEGEVIVTSSRAQLKISINEIPLLSKNTQGVRAIKISDGDIIVGLSKF